MFSTYFGKCSNITFNENPFRVSRVVPCGQKADTYDEAFCNFANAPKSGQKLIKFGKKRCSFNTVVENLQFNISFCSHT